MKKAWIYLAITAAINIIFRLISRLSDNFSEFYALYIYPYYSFLTVRITGMFPFSLIEFILIILICGVIAGLVFLIYRTVRILRAKEKGLKRLLLRAVSLVLCATSTVLLLLCFGCEINYQRKPFSYYSGLELSKYTDEILLDVIDELIEELRPLCDEIETDENGIFTMDTSKLYTVSRQSMIKLGENYPCLDAYYPPPKPIFLSEILLSQSLICGVFSPFTFEANFNNHMPESEQPFTVCHELSHLNGFMREDEANFIAYLACLESKDTDFLYSGYTRALTYSVIAYGNSVSDELYFEMYERIPLQVRAEFANTNDYWRPYRNTPIASAATSVNDAYLKANSQSDGTKSYGRFVDLLIADYLARQEQ